MFRGRILKQTSVPLSYFCIITRRHWGMVHLRVCIRHLSGGAGGQRAGSNWVWFNAVMYPTQLSWWRRPRVRAASIYLWRESVFSKCAALSSRLNATEYMSLFFGLFHNIYIINFISYIQKVLLHVLSGFVQHARTNIRVNSFPFTHDKVCLKYLTRHLESLRTAQITREDTVNRALLIFYLFNFLKSCSSAALCSSAPQVSQGNANSFGNLANLLLSECRPPLISFFN